MAAENAFLQWNQEVEPAPARSNADMVRVLHAEGSLRSQRCMDAFMKVDRKHFWPRAQPNLYVNLPLRSGRLHMSTPRLYAGVLEQLMPLDPGTSFLNIGSGTGYLNSLVAELTGESAVNHGLDIWDSTLEHARERSKPSIQYFKGNVYQLDVYLSMQYDRIYIGAAGTSEQSKHLYQLLTVGGVLVGPFESNGVQQMCRVVRKSVQDFDVEVLETVQFVTLVQPESTCSTPGSQETSTGAAAVSPGIPSLSWTFALNEKPWTPGRAGLYPSTFRAVAQSLLRYGRTDMPSEVWTIVLPFCSRNWFEPSQAPTGPVKSGLRRGSLALPLPRARHGHSSRKGGCPEQSDGKRMEDDEGTGDLHPQDSSN